MDDFRFHFAFPVPTKVGPSWPLSSMQEPRGVLPRVSLKKPLICPFQEGQKEIFSFCVTSSISKRQAFEGPESLWSAVVNIEFCNGPIQGWNLNTKDKNDTEVPARY